MTNMNLFSCHQALNKNILTIYSKTPLEGHPTNRTTPPSSFLPRVFFNMFIEKSKLKTTIPLMVTFHKVVHFGKLTVLCHSNINCRLNICARAMLYTPK